MEPKEMLNKKFDLKAQAAYDPAKVNVRKILSANSGGVNLLALDKDQKLDRHTAPGAVLITLLEGRTQFILEGQVLDLQTGEAFMMEAGTPHSVHALEPSKILLVRIDN